MKVIDASALVEFLLGTPAGLAIADELEDPDEGVHIPHLADVEVSHALRRLVSLGAVTESLAALALQDLQELDLQRHSHEPLLERMWELRKNVSAYDATYIALAEVLDAPLLTCDRRLARVPKANVKLQLIKQ